MPHTDEGCQHLAHSQSTDVLDLDIDQEVTEDGQSKEDLRERILQRYCRGIYKGDFCFELYDRYHLWPSHKGDFFSVWVEGIMSFRRKNNKDDPPVTCHKSVLSPDNAQDMIPYDRRVA